MIKETPSNEVPSHGRLATAFVMPLLLFLVLTAVEPSRTATPATTENGNEANETAGDDAAPENTTDRSGSEQSLDNYGQNYIAVYTIKILLVSTCLVIFWQAYLRNIPWRVSLVGLWVGLAGGFIWIALCWLSLEKSVFGELGLPESWLATRSGIDPNSMYSGVWLSWFFFIRFAGLVLVVPVAEELFLRGFLLRYFHDVNWPMVTFVQLTAKSIAISAVYGMVTHPAELIAAAVWFSLISVMMIRTGRFWDCVMAHAVTNAILGGYILATSSWHLW